MPVVAEAALSRSLLVVTAAEVEAAAFHAQLPAAAPVAVGRYDATHVEVDGCRVITVVGGIGPAAAAAATATALCQHPHDVVFSVGIAGGFAASGVAVGDVVVATESGYGDLGAESPAGFLDGEDLGWGPSWHAAAPELVAGIVRGLAAAGLAVHRGPIVTVSTITGTAATGRELLRRHPALAEAMEGAAVAATAAAAGRPALELRAVSNLVGDRDRAAWEVPRALGRLSEVAPAFIAAVAGTRMGAIE